MNISKGVMAMSQRTSRRNKIKCIQHREFYYYKAIQKLIDGKETPEYVLYRYRKLKRIRG